MYNNNTASATLATLAHNNHHKELHMNTIALRTGTKDRKTISALFNEKLLNILASNTTDTTYVNGVNNENDVKVRYLTRKEATELLVECNEKFGNSARGEIINIAYEFDTIERTLLVTKHKAAVQLLEELGNENIECMPELDITDVLCNDTIVGNLPVDVVANIYKRGASYIHLSFATPIDGLQKELTLDGLKHYGVTLQRYAVRAI
jgi:CRISPR-associated protein Csx16